MAEKFFTPETINKWIGHLEIIKNSSLNIIKILKREKVGLDEVDSFVIYTDGSEDNVEGPFGQANKSLAFAQYAGNIYRPAINEEISKYNSVSIKAISIASKLKSLPLIRGKYKAVPLVIINNIESLIVQISSFSEVSGLIRCVDANDKYIKSTGSPYDFDWDSILEGFGIGTIVEYVKELRRTPKEFTLKAEIPKYSNFVQEIQSNSNQFNTTITFDLEEDNTPGTGININNKDTRDLIDTANRLNETSDSGAIVVNENNQANEQYLFGITILCNQILSLCNEIVTDTTNLIYNINVRFRNITLPDNQDGVYNLSNWLYAFQKQVINAIYDNGEFIKQINNNQKTDSESLQTILNQVVQILTELTVVNTNINTAIQTTVDTRDLLQTDIINQNEIIHRIETNLTQFVADTKAQLDSIEEKQNVQANEIEIVKNLCLQILAKLN